MATPPDHPPVSDRAALLQIWGAALAGGQHKSTETKLDAHDSVLEELAAYFSITTEEARRRCVQWVDASVAEWKAAPRNTTEGLLDFYRTQTSWIFDTMWYHAKQTAGGAPPESVIIAERLASMRVRPGSLLDFGAGPGSTALFFHRLGWQVALADVSSTFLDFARWRLNRHDVPARFFDSSREAFPDNTYDVVTACDVMVHVPDPAATFRRLARALKPDGLLFFNVDARYVDSPDSTGFLYNYAYPVLRPVRVAGFEKLPQMEFFHVYRRLPDFHLTHRRQQIVSLLDKCRYNLAVALAGRMARTARARLKDLLPL